MRHSVTEPLDEDSTAVETGFGIAVIMAAMVMAASVCSGLVTLALMA